MGVLYSDFLFGGLNLMRQDSKHLMQRYKKGFSWMKKIVEKNDKIICVRDPLLKGDIKC